MKEVFIFNLYIFIILTISKYLASQISKYISLENCQTKLFGVYVRIEQQNLYSNASHLMLLFYLEL